MVKIAPSILSADFSRLGEQIRSAEEGGADWIHIDVMDGHFVPNLTFGAVVVGAVRSQTDLPFDLHLMIQHPERLVGDFQKAGADSMTIHIEAEHPNLGETLRQIRGLGCRVGLALNPATPLSAGKPHLSDVDILLLMTVNPGLAGQKFMDSVLPKIREARRYVDEEGLELEIEVDGGVKTSNASDCVLAGADVLVAGSAVYEGDPVQNLKAFREVITKNSRKVS